MKGLSIISVILLSYLQKCVSENLEFYEQGRSLLEEIAKSILDHNQKCLVHIFSKNLTNYKEDSRKFRLPTIFIDVNRRIDKAPFLPECSWMIIDLGILQNHRFESNLYCCTFSTECTNLAAISLPPAFDVSA